MKNRTMIIFAFTIVLALWACQNQRGKIKTDPDMIIAEAGVADYPSFTKDQDGNPVIWWSSTDSATDKAMVHFAVSRDGGKTFGEPVPIPATEGFASHSEGMAKLAIKSDGTMICVYQIHIDSEINRFAGQVLYVQSFDAGESWSVPARVHSDDNMDNSHAFVNMTITPDGEAMAVWLDGRNHLPYSQIFIATTRGRDGFGTDHNIVGPACQCCKLKLVVDSEDKLHLSYRGVTEDNIRDILHAVSEDDGQTWSEPQRIAPDNWQLDGCPHNGASFAANSTGYHFAWFTAGDSPGMSFTTYSRAEDKYLPKEHLSENGYNTNVTTLPDDRILVAWDEYIEGSQKIGLAVKSADGLTEVTAYIGVEGRAATFPAVLPLDHDQVLLAWGETGQGHSVIAARRIRLSQLKNQTVIIHRLTKL